MNWLPSIQAGETKMVEKIPGWAFGKNQSFVKFQDGRVIFWLSLLKDRLINPITGWLSRWFFWNLGRCLCLFDQQFHVWLQAHEGGGGWAVRHLPSLETTKTPNLRNERANNFNKKPWNPGWQRKTFSFPFWGQGWPIFRGRTCCLSQGV